MGKVRYDFSGESVVVTGASRGIGYAIAAAFVRAGAGVSILAHDEEVYRAAETLSYLGSVPVRAYCCDITDREAVRRTLAQFERIDVLVNNAGLEQITPIRAGGDEVEDTFRRILDINVNGTYYVTRDALKVMGAGGRILLTASIWSKTAVPEFSAYCASKHANIGFMRALAQELGPEGIRVNAVCPGWVRTDASMRSLREMAHSGEASEENLLADIVAAQALDGMMEPDDVAEAYLHLASDAARNVTGQALMVDRGEVMS
ncbi:MAG: SDR family oxidoreductase [Oceanospirillaceae bacterium]|nr:SDR family oxidoreductase [Oceanospirillaceae bacterium]